MEVCGSPSTAAASRGTSVAVYAIGTAGRGGATPVRLALASTALTALIYAVALSDQKLLQQYHFWSVGALGGRGRTPLAAVAPFILAGLLLALALARPLDALALGDDSARALGAKVAPTRILGAVSVTLLCGGATAAAARCTSSASPSRMPRERTTSTTRVATRRT